MGNGLSAAAITYRRDRWVDVLDDDLHDSYWWTLRSPWPTVQPTRVAVTVALFLYLLLVSIRPFTMYRVVRGDVDDAAATAIATHPSSPPNAAARLYVSPEGLRMTVRDDFDPTMLQMHRWAGALLLLLAWMQKESVPFLKAQLVRRGVRRTATATATGTHPPLLDSNRRRKGPAATLTLGRDTGALGLHAALVGQACIVLMAVMAFAGFSLRSTPISLAHFPTAMIAFVAPWVAFVFSVGKSASKGWSMAHAMLGNLVFKSCIAVLVARLLGVALQRALVGSVPAAAAEGSSASMMNTTTIVVSPAFFAAVTGAADPAVALSDGACYYIGIAGGALCGAVWQVIDWGRWDNADRRRTEAELRRRRDQ